MFVTDLNRFNRLTEILKILKLLPKPVIQFYFQTCCFQITYEAVGTVQMNFLRLLSDNGYQNFTYTCINSAAWFNAKDGSYDLSVQFMGEDAVQFSSKPGQPKVNVLTDGCKVNASKRTVHSGFYSEVHREVHREVHSEVHSESLVVVI